MCLSGPHKKNDKKYRLNVDAIIFIEGNLFRVSLLIVNLDSIIYLKCLHDSLNSIYDIQ